MDQPRTPGTRARSRWVLATLLLVASSLASVAALPALRRFARSDRAAEGAALRVAEVKLGELRRDIATQGRVVAALHPTLFARAEGIVSLSVKAGTEVKLGAVLARVDSPSLQARLLQERATLEGLRGELARQQLRARQLPARTQQTLAILRERHAAASRAAERADLLREQGLLNGADDERTRLDLALAVLELGNAKDAAALERENLDFEIAQRARSVERQASITLEFERQVQELVLRAPFAGMVATVVVQDQDAVKPADPILTLVNLAVFEIEFALPEGQAADVTPGLHANVSYEGKEYAARVTTISPEVRDNQVRGSLVFDGEPPNGLRQSQRVSVHFILEHKSNVKKLARGPFVENGGGRYVYELDGDLAIKRPVQLGVMSLAEVEVVDGLEVGARVVISDTTAFEGAATVLIR